MPQTSVPSLNREQARAVAHRDGPLLIVAGAGAGKTKVVTERILTLIKSGVAPSEILAITFTNKAAREMRERVEKLLAEDRSLNSPVSQFERPFVSTFHALGVHMLKENARILGLPRHFAIFDRSDSLGAIRDAIKEVGLDPKQFEPNKMLSAISREKNAGTTQAEYASKEDKEYWNSLVARVWEKYEQALANEKALDFDDLLLRTLFLLRDHKEVLLSYQNLWRYIHVDEYQDTNKVQYELMQLLAAQHRNLCVVGDIDQSIYSWRGADFRNLLRFEEDYPDATVITLEQNYRSTKTILAAANSVITKNTLRKEKNLVTDNPLGEKISLYAGWSEEDEAQFVVQSAAGLIEAGTLAEEIAVLYRANFQSRVLEEAFLLAGVPYQVLGTRFFERREVKDMLSYLRAALNPDSLADIKRIINVPPRGLGKVAVAKIFSGQRTTLSGAASASAEKFYTLLTRIKTRAEEARPSELVAYIFEESGLAEDFRKGGGEGEERAENIAELASLARKYDDSPIPEGLERLLTDAALASDQDSLEKKGEGKKNGVKLMTVHAAKGLEFDQVFVTGLEQDLFPHVRHESERSGDRMLEAEEEERRLFYVALTRARKRLHLSYASSRTIFGSRQVNIPSDFLGDIDEALLEGVDRESKGKVIYLDD